MIFSHGSDQAGSDFHRAISRIRAPLDSEKLLIFSGNIVIIGLFENTSDISVVHVVSFDCGVNDEQAENGSSKRSHL